MAKRLTNSELANVRDQMVLKQGRKCAICGFPFTSRDGPCVDHDHDTGFIRAAIHRSCNQAEGRVKTKAMLGHTGVPAYDYIIRLGKYLELHQTPRYPLIHPLHKTEEEKRLAKNKRARTLRAKKKETK